MGLTGSKRKKSKSPEYTAEAKTELSQGRSQEEKSKEEKSKIGKTEKVEGKQSSPHETEKKAKTDQGDVTKTIHVPKKRHGLIIGPQGATIKDLRKQTGAEVTLPDSASDSDEVTIKGTASAVDSAVKYIEGIMQAKDAEHQKKVDGHEAVSQATEKIYAKYQTDIDRAAKKRSECFDQAEKEYANGHKDKAAQLRKEAKEQTAIMEELQKKASTEIFESLNKQYKDGTTIDLHGLHVETALQFLEERINSLRSKGVKELLIIYGAGNHSKKEVGARIKPEVQKFLKEKGISSTEINNGSVSATL
eukprot:TRINITY_DN4207_c0_g3_i2.p1 TRINITY_DN4207_c0_g3~~TRINITY_DN4207_c0_g3_i2.p1  ORF type:complete len:305 (+),score=84.91 TRINITY_DN4207_c0_g3_i2:232-1146(+)